MLQRSAEESSLLGARSCLCPPSSLGLPAWGRPCVAHTLVRGVWMLVWSSRSRQCGRSAR